MTVTAKRVEANNVYHWDEDIRLSVVDEYVVVIECCEYDEVSRSKNSVGFAEVCLLPLFKTGRLDAEVNLSHMTEVSG